MRLVLLTLPVAVLAGLLAGGRIGRLATVPIRSFALRNIALPGFPLILLGLVLNLTVIGPNGGMPVSEDALVRSGQAGSLTTLERDGGSKHHLATEDDILLPLGDVIALPPPVRQAVSVGDIATHSGMVWLIVWGMLYVPAERRREDAHASAPAVSTGAARLISDARAGS